MPFLIIVCKILFLLVLLTLSLLYYYIKTQTLFFIIKKSYYLCITKNIHTMKQFAPKGFRMDNGFIAMRSLSNNVLFSSELKRFIDVTKTETSNTDTLSNNVYCHSKRAFKRRLKKAPKNVKYILESKYVYKSRNICLDIFA